MTHAHDLKLTRPLVVFDLETTGTWVDKDRIIELAMIRLDPAGQRRTYFTRVNPQMPIPPSVTAVTGLSDADVAAAPTFKDIAADVAAFLEGADLAGFNIERFDLPVLMREFKRAAVPFVLDGRQIFDVQKIYHLNERRDLSAAYAFYCGRELDNAHSALADTEATLAVLQAQVKKYGRGGNELSSLLRFDYTQTGEFYDRDRRLRWWNGRLYMMFGKYARKKSLQDVAAQDPRYLQWILEQDFSDEVKRVVEDALAGHFPDYEEWKKQRAQAADTFPSFNSV